MDIQRKFYVGIDVGTTNAKCVIINDLMKVVAKNSIEYSINSPQPGWAEQSPDMWWDTVWQLCKEVIGKFEYKQGICKIGVSGQMHGLVTLDSNLKVIRPAILWNDQRSADESKEIIQLAGGEEALLDFTNNNMLTGYTGSKIYWLQKHEQENSGRIHKIVMPKDYIRYKLTGEIFTDVTDASGTGLFNVKERCWSTELLSKIGIPIEWLPKVINSTDQSGVLKPELAEQLGLKKNIPIIAGAGDAVIQPLGSGILDTSEGLLVIGTGGNVTIHSPEFKYNSEGRLQFFCGVLPNSYVAIGVTLSAGGSLKWFRDLLKERVNPADNENYLTYQELDSLAKESPVGANGLLFLPYLSGERCPHPDEYARGAFIGINTQTSISDMVRGVMEGICYSLKDITKLMDQAGFVSETYCLSGGGADSELWKQILADVFDCKITTVATSSEGSAFGVAILAGMADKAWSRPVQIKEGIPTVTTNDPSTEDKEKYSRMFSIYQKGYPQLKAIFHELNT